MPDTAECFRLMEEFGMLPNIRRHSIVVARVALLLVDGLHAHGATPPDRSLAAAGALLHDIAKTPCLRDRCDHAAEGARICEELGYPEVAAIVRDHVILREHDPVRRGQGIFTGEEIIYYADKRVRHEEVVSLDERLAYILEQYGNGDPRLFELIRANFRQCEELEKALFAFLPYGPEAVSELVATCEPEDWENSAAA
ncbi:MAG: HDIG domain-containing protein [Desulfobulbaceae bacterium]